MDRSSKRRQTKPDPVARGARTPKRIGFIGRTDISDSEKETLIKIGRSLARLGHTLVTVPAEGATACVREGVEAEKGHILDLHQGVLEQSDHTLLYASPRLLERLRSAYPALEISYKVTILRPHQLQIFWGAMAQIMAEQGIAIPK